MTDTFSTGLTDLAGYLSNTILPSCAGLCVVVGIFQFSHRRDGWRYFLGAMACLMVSAFVACVQKFSNGGTPEAAIHALAVWLANVILPTYSVFCFARGFLAVNGFMDHLEISEDYLRFFVTGGMCFCASGILDLIIHFVQG